MVLSDGEELPADVCLLGVGALPCTEMLKGAVELDERGYVVVDKVSGRRVQIMSTVSMEMFGKAV